MIFPTVLRWVIDIGEMFTQLRSDVESMFLVGWGWNMHKNMLPSMKFIFFVILRQALIKSSGYTGGDYIFVPVHIMPPSATDFVHTITFEQLWDYFHSWQDWLWVIYVREDNYSNV